MNRRYLVVYERGTGSYSGYAPDVPGCGSVGDTLEEMRRNMAEALEFRALEFHFEGLAEDSIRRQGRLPAMSTSCCTAWWSGWK